MRKLDLTIVELDDFESLKANKMRKLVLDVLRIGTIENPLIKTEIAQFDNKQRQLLLDSSTDDERLILLMEREEGLPLNTRRELCEAGETWLFDDEQIERLEPIATLSYNDGIKTPEGHDYFREAVIHGPYRENPARQGLSSSSLYAQVAIYRTQATGIVHSFRVIFELGQIDDRENNLIALYRARQIPVQDMK